MEEDPGLILPCPLRYRHDSGQELHKISSGYMNKKIREKKSVQCFADFFIAVIIYYPRSEEVPTAIEKNPGYDLPYPLPCFFAAEGIRFNLGAY